MIKFEKILAVATGFSTFENSTALMVNSANSVEGSVDQLIRAKRFPLATLRDSLANVDIAVGTW